MRFSPPDDEVKLYETVFERDLLGRNRVSGRLSAILERIEDPLVVALDGRWGTGKSYFLQRWVGAHTKQNDGTALTLYFDAFANDYLSDPLAALVGALSNRVGKDGEKQIERVKRAALKFVKPLARLSLAVASYGATEALSGVGDAVVGSVTDDGNNAINEFWKKEEGRQAAMEEFRAALETLTHPDTDADPTPLVIVVDELDRCRPDYALEVLEVIKHFFSVPHVHFVLGVNLQALENSVKARYGTEIDATAYLQKFISFTMNLPDHLGDNEQTPATVEYARYLVKKMEIGGELRGELIEQIALISRTNNVSIRDIGKIMSLAALLPAELSTTVLPGYRIVAVSLLLAKVLSPKVFHKLLVASIAENELVEYLGSTEEFITEYDDEK